MTCEVLINNIILGNNIINKCVDILLELINIILLTNIRSVNMNMICILFEIYDDNEVRVWDELCSNVG